MKAGIFLNRGGFISRKALFWLLFLGAALYLGVKLVPPVVSHYMLKYEVESEAKNAHFYKDETLRNRIFEKAMSWSVPIKRDDIKITRWTREIEISINYARTIVFLNRYKKTFVYNIRVVKPLKESRGFLR